MDIREMIAELVKVNNGDYNCMDLECHLDVECPGCIARHILSLETDTERIAIVKKEPVLPGVEHSICTRESRKAQQDMLKAGFVQLKEGE